MEELNDMNPATGVNLEELPLYGSWMLADRKDEPVPARQN